MTDWASTFTKTRRAMNALAWLAAAVAVALLVSAVAAVALRLDARAGREEGTEAAFLIDLDPGPPPPPSMMAVAESAPEAQMVEAPEMEQPEEPVEEEIAELPEELPPEMEQPELEPVDDLPDVLDESFAELPPPPPEPEVVPPDPAVAAARPQSRPEPRPEPQVEPRRERPREERQVERRPRAPSQAQAQSQARSDSGSTGQTAVSAGQIRDLRAAWGGSIRSRIERRRQDPRGAWQSGRVTVQLQVSRDGTLLGVSIAGSSGQPPLDEAAIRAVRAAAGSFPAAPAGLSEASYTFTLPISFTRR